MRILDLWSRSKLVEQAGSTSDRKTRSGSIWKYYIIHVDAEKLNTKGSKIAESRTECAKSDCTVRSLANPSTKDAFVTLPGLSTSHEQTNPHFQLQHLIWPTILTRCSVAVFRRKQTEQVGLPMVRSWSSKGL